MQFTTSIDEQLSLLRIDVLSNADAADVPAQYRALLVAVARSNMTRLLIDYSGMREDISLTEFLEIRSRCGRLIRAIRRIKTAVVLRQDLDTTIILLAALRTFGVRLAAFDDRADALQWLMRDDDAPPLRTTVGGRAYY